MIYWAKFEGKLFFDPECTGPLLQTLPLNGLGNLLLLKFKIKVSKELQIINNY